MIYLFLADGFEDIEALTPLDVLKRGGVSVVTVGVGGEAITSKSGVKIVCDIREDSVDFTNMEGIILPGGIPGVPNLKKSKVVSDAITFANENGLLIGAICAAPSILGEAGLLKGVKATCYPSFEETFKDTYTGESTSRHKHFVTGKGAGVSLKFAFELLKYLKGDKAAEEIAKGMMCE